MTPIPSGSEAHETIIDVMGVDHVESSIPIDLHVKNLSYSVLDKPGSWWQKLTNIQMPWEWMEEVKEKQILNDINFTAKSGKLMAVMGGSGSGKTTLLDVIACRTGSGKVSGRVVLNDVLRTKDIIDSCAGYVRQDDRLIAFLTVKETLMFVAQLKLPKTFTTDMIKHRVDMVIAELGLKHVADTRVGDANIRGLSGGERRRVSIGIHLLILPSIILLDEPTSGLDSFTASNISRTLSRLANKGRTIVMSIHQPRFDIFNVVDTIMILSKGQIVFNGPAKEMVSYFTSLGYPCPQHTNPCDFYIDLATVDPTSKEREEKSWAVVHTFHEAFKAAQAAEGTSGSETVDVNNVIEVSEVQQKSMDTIAASHSLKKDFNKSETLHSLIAAFERQKATPGFFSQFGVIFTRFVRVTFDDWTSLLFHIIQAIMMSLLLGVMYVDLKLDARSVRDWFGIMFMVSVMYPYMVILGLIGHCHEERRFLYFELQDKLYKPSAYYFARIASDLPFHILFVMFYLGPLYFITGLKLDAYTMVTFFAFGGLSVYTSRCLAMMAAAILPTFQLGCFLAQILFSLWIMSGGFLINIHNIIEATRWMSSINYLRWGFEALCKIQIEDLTFDCGQAPVESCPPNGTIALQQYGLDGEALWQCSLGLLGTIVVFLSIMFIGIKYVPQKPHDE